MWIEFLPEAGVQPLGEHLLGMAIGSKPILIITKPMLKKYDRTSTPQPPYWPHAGRMTINKKGLLHIS